jgi:hypothetical protein
MNEGWLWLHLENGDQAVADVDHARVLAGPHITQGGG